MSADGMRELPAANGMALAVSDSELRQAAKSLASGGIFAEYASAATGWCEQGRAEG